jgi:hypothetical protein
MCVDPHIAMSNKRLMRLMHELDRVFHRDDMARRGAIAVINHGGKRGRLT